MIKLRNTVIPNRYDNRKNGILGALTKLGSAVSGLNPITSLVGAGISGVTSMIGANKQANAQKEINAQQLALQREQMQQQQAQFESQQAYQTMDWQRNRNAALEDWSKQRGAALEDFIRENQWNSPAAQRARFEAAGLNPALAMEGQSAAVGQMEATSAPSAASGSSPSPGGMPSLPQLGVPVDGTGQAIDRAMTAFGMITNAEKTSREAAGIDLDNKLKGATFNERVLEFKLRNLEAQQRVDSMKLDPKIKEMEIANLRRQGEILDDAISLNTVTFDSRSKQQSTLNYYYDRMAAKANQEAIAENIRNEFARTREIMSLKLSAAQLDSIAQSIAESKSRVGLNDAMAAHTALQSIGINPKTPQGEVYYKTLEKALRQMESDYYNPFKYTNGALSNIGMALLTRGIVK